MTYLIQILLPLRDNGGTPYDGALFKEINANLVRVFGGVTTFSRAPAKGHWLHEDHEERDDVIVVEVMAESLDTAWWKAFRERLEGKLNQTEIVIRAHAITRL